jgi:hypothetical protein
VNFPNDLQAETLLSLLGLM